MFHISEASIVFEAWVIQTWRAFWGKGGCVLTMVHIFEQVSTFAGLSTFEHLYICRDCEETYMLFTRIVHIYIHIHILHIVYIHCIYMYIYMYSCLCAGLFPLCFVEATEVPRLRSSRCPWESSRRPPSTSSWPPWGARQAREAHACQVCP